MPLSTPLEYTNYLNGLRRRSILPIGCSQTTPLNLLVAPNTFSNAAWSANNTNVTFTAAAASDPCGGGSDGWQLLDNSTAGIHQTFQGVTIASAGGTTTAALFVKQSTGRYVIVAAGKDGSNFIYANADTQTGLITQTGTNGVGTLQSATSTPAGNGWYYITVTGVGTNTTAIFFVLSVSNSATPGTDGPSYTGTGTGIFVYQARLSNGSQ